MHYSYEFKMMCVELYHSGAYPDIPEGLNPDTLKHHIREWSRLVDLHDPEGLNIRCLIRCGHQKKSLNWFQRLLQTYQGEKLP